MRYPVTLPRNAGRGDRPPGDRAARARARAPPAAGRAPVHRGRARVRRRPRTARPAPRGALLRQGGGGQGPGAAGVVVAGHRAGSGRGRRGRAPARAAGCARDACGRLADALADDGRGGRRRPMRPLYTADEMRATDAWAIEEQRIPGIELMERAGGALASELAAVAPGGTVDVASGVDAGTGEIAGRAVRAVATVTFHAAKPGLWINPGKEHAGRVVVADIGIPDGGPAQPQILLLDDELLEQVPRRLAPATKFTSGHVLVCGGSTGLTGAPTMACLAAMRAGAGYVTACIPASLNAIFEVKLTEVMTRPLPDDAGALWPAGAETVLGEAERRGGALVLGPGSGREQPTVALLRDVAARAPVPLVLDADGLNAHAGELERLAAREAPAVLTPH